MFIRDAELGDWLPVRDILIEAHDKSPYGHIAYSENDGKRMYAVAVKSHRHLSLVVADKKNRIHGILIGQITLNWWGARVATELVSYANQPGWMARLLRRYKRWGEEQEANIITVVNSGGENPRYERLIEKLGFTKAGGVLMSFPTEK